MRSGSIRAFLLCMCASLLFLTFVGSLTSCREDGCVGGVSSVYQGESDDTSDSPTAPDDDISSEPVSTEETSSDVSSRTSEVKPLRITTQPKSALVEKKGSVKISVKAKGNGLTYQWYVKTDSETEYTAGKGLTRASLTVRHDGKWNNMFCYCMVTDSVGHTAVSDVAVITLQRPMKLLAVGDSICRGGRNSKKGFVGDLGLPYVNAGQNGATLSTKETAVTNIPDQLAGVTNYSPDIIIADGGVNDYIYNVPLGTVPKSPVSDVTGLSGEDLSTVMGGLQKLFALMRDRFPEAKRYYVITHKTTQRVPKLIEGKYVYTDGDRYVDWTVTSNKAGYTQQQLHDAIVACCKVYDVEVIDIYQKSELNTADRNFCSKTSYFDDPSVTDSEYVDIDGVHPLQKGYSEYYLPLIRKQMKKVLQQQTSELPLEILMQPTNAEIAPGESLTLSLSASGNKLSYQWYYKKAGQTAISEWKGRIHESETVTPNASWDGIQLYCVVTDSHGNTIQSDTVSVTVR